MNTFELVLQDATHIESFKNVSCFVGEDASGSFSILAGHVHFITALNVGLARFRLEGVSWKHLALPGGVLNFRNNVMTLSTRHYLMDDDYRTISAALQQELLSEEQALHSMKESLRRLEDEFLKRMWEMGRRSGGQMR